MSHSTAMAALDVDPGGQPLCLSPLALSMPRCRLCDGSGVVTIGAEQHTCECVHRRVFHACLTSYQHCQASLGAAGTVQFERVGHAQGRCALVASFKRAEYSADFVLAARRALAGRPLEEAVFDAYHLDDMDWRDAVARVNRRLYLPRPLSRASFFRAVHRVENLVGEAIATAQPYSIFPPRTYFAGFTISAATLVTSRVRPR